MYHDDFAQSADECDEHNINEDGERFRKNTDSNGRFHSDWCSMMYARLMVARILLTDDGVILISIDDSEIESLRKICDQMGQGTVRVPRGAHLYIKGWLPFHIKCSRNCQ